MSTEVNDISRQRPSGSSGSIDSSPAGRDSHALTFMRAKLIISQCARLRPIEIVAKQQ